MGLVAELLGRADAVMLATQVSGVFVCIAASEAERQRMVDYIGESDQAGIHAVLAHVVRALQATFTLGNAGSAAKSLGHPIILIASSLCRG